ncbi:MAG: DUF1559 domain-containing protein [Planctomycetia bacterium]|nr:DUF1559 domain-containing protein [Planctomycetia bacterium]
MIAIIGTLIGLLLPAVQRARESARMATCSTNLRQIALGVCSYESARRSFPAGYDATPHEPALPEGTQHAWSSVILPTIDEQSLASRINYASRWDAPGGNDIASDQSVATYACASGIVPSIGKADYGGVAGSWIVEEGIPFAGAAGFSNGILFAVDADHRPARAASVTDGLSQTLLVAEAADRGTANEPADAPDATGRWARINCFAQSASFINTRGSDIASNHVGGAQVAFADGRVTFLSDMTEPRVLAAICTRNGGEAESSSRADK